MLANQTKGEMFVEEKERKEKVATFFMNKSRFVLFSVLFMCKRYAFLEVFPTLACTHPRMLSTLCCCLGLITILS